jgi:DNA-binding transcriptional MerR regulator
VLLDAASLWSMSRTYSIGELAAAVGLPASTVRYYEREGLLVPDGRTESNYRVYGGRSLDRLTFIRAAQASGLVLDDVKRLLALRDGCAAPCHEVQELLERRLAEAEQRLLDLRRVRSVLRSSLALCKEAEATGRCQVIEDLGRGTAGGRGRSRPASRKKLRNRQP